MIRGILLSGSLLILSACSGMLYSQRLPVASLNDPGFKTEGVVYYPNALYKEVTSAKLLDDGKTPLTSECRPVTTVKIVSHPDYSRPMIVHYVPGLFDSSTFAATLTSEGGLSSVNSQSTSDQGNTLNNAANAAKTFATIAGVAVAAAAPTPTHGSDTSKQPKPSPTLPVCNVGNVDLEPMPVIPAASVGETK